MSETDDKAAPDPSGEASVSPAPVSAGPARTDMRFAYHDGPPDIIFAGRTWRRGVPQPVTRQELRSMTRRAGWVVFDFRQMASN